MNNNNFEYHVLVYLLVGILIVNILILIRNISSISGFPHPYLSCVLPLVIILVFFPLRKKLSKMNKIYKVTIIGVVGVSYIFIVQTFLLCLSAIFMGYSLIITLVSCGFVFIDRFSTIRNEVSEIENKAKKNKNLDKEGREYIHFLHEDAKYWLDILIKGIYWLGLSIVTSISILWGLAWGKESTLGLLVFTSGFFIVYLYLLFGIFLWMFFPIYQHVEKTRHLLR